MDHSRHDLASAEAFAVKAARHWDLELGPAFALSTVSYVAPAGDLVVKIAWGGDDESLTSRMRWSCGEAMERCA